MFHSKLIFDRNFGNIAVSHYNLCFQFFMKNGQKRGKDLEISGLKFLTRSLLMFILKNYP